MDGQIDFSEVLRLDEHGNVDRQTWLEADGSVRAVMRYRWTYDEAGLPIRRRQFLDGATAPNGDGVRRWEHDAEGRVLSETWIDLEHGEPEERWEYAYDRRGRLVSKEYFEAGRLNDWEHWDYESGLLVRRSSGFSAWEERVETWTADGLYATLWTPGATETWTYVDGVLTSWLVDFDSQRDLETDVIATGSCAWIDLGNDHPAP